MAWRKLARQGAAAAASAIVTACISSISLADRVVLAPAGTTLSENSFRSEIAISSNGRDGDYGWAAYSSGDGIEMELNRFEAVTERNKRWSMNIEYPLPTLKNLPAISLGIRDLTGTAVEHGALYAASTIPVPLSHRERHLLRAFNFSVGAGTGRIGGAFAGIDGRLKSGITLDAEVYRHRLDYSAGVPLMRNLQIKGYMLDGHVFYGMSFALTR